MTAIPRTTPHQDNSPLGPLPTMNTTQQVQYLYSVELSWWEVCPDTQIFNCYWQLTVSENKTRIWNIRKCWWGYFIHIDQTCPVTFKCILHDTGLRFHISSEIDFGVSFYRGGVLPSEHASLFLKKRWTFTISFDAFIIPSNMIHLLFFFFFFFFTVLWNSSEIRNIYTYILHHVQNSISDMRTWHNSRFNGL